MPYRKYKRKRKRKVYKRRYRRKRRRFGRITRFKLKTPSLLPDTCFVKLKYVDFITMTNVAGLGAYTYRMNSLFDPDFTGTGHQPMGFDQWSNFYSHYQVLASKIRVHVLPPDTNLTGFAIYPSNDITNLASYSVAREQPYAKSSWVNVGASILGSMNTSYMKIKKLEARSTDSVNFSASINANPSNVKYWHMVLQSVSGSDISDIRLDIRITYYCKFFRRNTLVAS